MAIFRIGESEFDLRVVGAGLQNGQLPPPLDRGGTGWDLSVDEFRDLEAFEEAGWRFHPQTDLNWGQAREINLEEIEAGLLARHPSGGLVILRNHLVVNLPLGVPPDGEIDAEKLPLNGDLYDVRVRLPDYDLQGAILRQLAAFEERAKGVVGVDAEPSVVYHLVHHGNLFTVQTDESLQWQWDQIHLTDAWAAGNYGNDVRVAIIDLGFHDKEKQIEPNISETAFVNDKGVHVQNAQLPTHSHGTFCAGLVGALRDNVTVNGAAPECTLMLVAVQSTTTQIAVAKAIELCAAGISGGRGADVISCSLGPNGRSWELSKGLKDAIDRAHGTGRGGHGTPIVWADFDAHKPIDPKSLEAYCGIICVGQSNRQDAPVSSGHGPGLDLLAPGTGLTGILWKSGMSRIGCGSGCSYAAPSVAGVAALVLAKRPGLKWHQVADVLTQSCDRPGHPNTRTDAEGWGRLNALLAVQRA